MTFSEIGFLASGLMLLVVIVDCFRGVTGVGKRRFTKQEAPTQYWAGICLYLNMTFWMFWLAGRAFEPASVICDPKDEACEFVLEGKSE